MNIDKTLIKSFVNVSEKAAYGGSIHKGKGDKDKEHKDKTAINPNKPKEFKEDNILMQKTFGK